MLVSAHSSRNSESQAVEVIEHKHVTHCHCSGIHSRVAKDGQAQRDHAPRLLQYPVLSRDTLIHWRVTGYTPLTHLLSESCIPCRLRRRALQRRGHTTERDVQAAHSTSLPPSPIDIVRHGQGMIAPGLLLLACNIMLTPSPVSPIHQK